MGTVEKQVTLRRIMEKQRRKKLASLPFPEKIKILEKLRRVSQTAAKSGLRKQMNEKLVPRDAVEEMLS
jgi:DnaJ-domain-containing protein 1